MICAFQSFPSAMVPPFDLVKPSGHGALDSPSAVKSNWLRDEPVRRRRWLEPPHCSSYAEGGAWSGRLFGRPATTVFSGQETRMEYDYDPDDSIFDDPYADDDVFFRTCGKCGVRTSPAGRSRPAWKRPVAMVGDGWPRLTGPVPTEWTSAAAVPLRRATALLWPAGATEGDEPITGASAEGARPRTLRCRSRGR